MDSGVEQGGWIAGVVTGLVTLSTVGYRALRRVKEDGADDRRVARGEDFVDGLMKRIADLEKYTDDAFAERNRAVQAEGLLTGKLEAANRLLADLEVKVKELREEAKELKAENAGLKKRVGELEDLLKKGGGNALPLPPINTSWSDCEV